MSKGMKTLTDRLIRVGLLGWYPRDPPKRPFAGIGHMDHCHSYIWTLSSI